MTTAPRTATPATLAPIDVGPILVLTGQADAQEVSFHDEVPVGAQGWSPGYTFGSAEAAEVRWRAARETGVDFIATDPYERLAAVLHTRRARP